MERARVVPIENLHVTIAFLGSRPASETASIADALRESVRGVSEPVFAPERYRETRSVGMLVLSDEDGRATRIAEEAQRRLAEMGVYEPEQRPGFRISRSSASASGRGSSRRSPTWAR